MTRTRWIIFALICILVVGGLIIFSNRDRVDVSEIDPAKVYTSGAIPDHVFGNADSNVVLIEYGDFQCPGCASLHPKLHPLLERYKDDIAFVFRHFPLTNIHPNALAAAAVAEAAGLQGKFYEMHDLLFEQQSAWSSANTTTRTDTFKAFAEQLGLDVDKFVADLSSAEVSHKIRRDQALGRVINVESTPTLVLNGETLSNSTWQENTVGLEERIRETLRSQGLPLPKPVNALSEDEEASED